MKLRTLLLCLAGPALALAEPDALSNSQAYLAATLAALNTPKMKDAPIQVNAAISNATGVQENYGAKAIVAIPDEKVIKLDLAHLPDAAQPLCRLWVKGYTLARNNKAIISEKAAKLKVDAEGEKHDVTVWLIGVRKSKNGKPEIIVCADQKAPALILPATAVKAPTVANKDAPIDVSASDTELRLTILGSHEITLELRATES